MAAGFTVEIEWYLDRVGVQVQNGDAFTAWVAAFLANRVVERAKRGLGAEEAPLPRPKDAGTKYNQAGQPLQRTGQLLASVKAEKRGEGRYLVHATGKRVETKTQTKDLKGRLVRQRDPVTGKPIRGAFQGYRMTAKGRRIKVYATPPKVRAGASRVQKTIHQSNAEIAAMLEHPGKGLRAGSPVRPPIVFIRASEAEMQEAGDRALELLRVELAPTGQRVTGST